MINEEQDRIIELAQNGVQDYIQRLKEQSMGGSGETFRWDLIPELRKPYFLAGGLSSENISEALKWCRPWAVDVSSSVETDGRKEEEKVRQFIEAFKVCSV